MDKVFCRRPNGHCHASFTLGNGLLPFLTLTGGGHVADVRLEDSTGFPNTCLLWVPPCDTIEPYRYRADIHSAKCGASPGGRAYSGGAQELSEAAAWYARQVCFS
jgi:hypothetical protein